MSSTPFSFKLVWKLITPYWKSKEKWMAFGILSTIIGLSLAEVYINVRLNRWNNDFYNALQAADKGAFFGAIKLFTVLAIGFIIIVVYKNYLNMALNIRWRRWMTENYIGRWMRDQTYYRMQITGNLVDNPDQRIADDTGQFIGMTLSLGLGVLSSIVTLFSFLAILWNLSGAVDIPLWDGQHLHVAGYMVWAAIGYAVVGTYITKILGRPLIPLNFHQQKFEADFRFSLVRLREYSESIAFYKGEAHEQKHFMESFMKIFENYYRIMRRQKTLTWFTAGYFQIANIFPFFVAAPRFFAGGIKLGQLMQTASAFGQVQGSLSFIIDAYTNIATWRAVIDRLSGFHYRMDEVSGEQSTLKFFQTEAHAAQSLDVDGLSINLPDRSNLQNGITFSVARGRSLLIQGPSGCGKSTVLRTIAGIWPYAEGKVAVPAGSTCMFLPQKPYLPLGTLQQVLSYPASEPVSPGELHDLLILCKIGHLWDSLYKNEIWAHVLSLGEQQRVAFLRALIVKPDILFLDETTSALDEEVESYFYRLLREKMPDSIIISVGHRHTLKDLHTDTIEFNAPPRLAP